MNLNTFYPEDDPSYATKIPPLQIYTTIDGGYYSSDLFSGTYIAGGSYTYHMTDETAVEFAGWWTHANADIVRALEDQRGTVLTDTYAPIIFAESLLEWSPVYGKLRLGGTIVHFDLHADAGVGVIDSKSSRGAAGVLGFGIKLFVGQAVAFRIDARNLVGAEFDEERNAFRADHDAIRIRTRRR